ncbi:hypothetical protein ACX0G9_25405 [Flavitalea flava]
METFTLLKIGLIVHLIGITTMVGLTVANFLALQQLWKYLLHEQDKAMLILKAISRFPVFQMIGGMFVVLGGITMMLALHGVFMHQTWFKVKMVLLVLIILNAIFMARPAGKKLGVLLTVNSTIADTTEPGIVAVKKRLTFFHLLQLLLFFIIFILSVFQFTS